MGLLKSINENYKGLESGEFFHPGDLDELRDRINEGIMEWIPLGVNYQIRTFEPGADVEDQLTELWKNLPEDRISILLVRSNENWVQRQLQIFTQLVDDEAFSQWLVIYNCDTQQMINPVEDHKIGLINKIFGSPIKTAKKTIRSAEPAAVLLSYLLDAEDKIPDQQQLMEQGNIDNEEFEGWKSRLQNAGMWEEDEELLDIARVRVRRNHYTVRTNLKRSGKIIVTNKRIVFVRRAFSLFGFGIASIVPILAFVRPANKFILLARALGQYLKVPLKVAKPFFSSIWPSIATIIVAVNFIDIGALIQSVRTFLRTDLGLGFALPALNFVIENPWTLASFGGFYALIRIGMLKTFFRRKRLITLPHDQLSYLTIDNNELVGRWKVKGSSTVQAEDGIQYRMRISSKDDNISDKQLAQRIQTKILDQYPQESLSQDTNQE